MEPTAPLPRYNRRSSHQSAPAKVCGEFCLVQPLKPGPPRNPTASLCRFSVALAPLGSSGILQITRTPAPAPTPYAPHDQIDQQEWPPRATLTVLWGYPALNTCRATGAMAHCRWPHATDCTPPLPPPLPPPPPVAASGARFSPPVPLPPLILSRACSAELADPDTMVDDLLDSTFASRYTAAPMSKSK